MEAAVIRLAASSLRSFAAIFARKGSEPSR